MVTTSRTWLRTTLATLVTLIVVGSLVVLAVVAVASFGTWAWLVLSAVAVALWVTPTWVAPDAPHRMGLGLALRFLPDLWRWARAGTSRVDVPRAEHATHRALDEEQPAPRRW
ncbi:hypothetical protein [Cellulomonas xylanilytica]|uniref:Uncharacterized protein n=1 Tax=Cellulomonas xylanilytica TaxID=233583 RepID=A0A510UZ56_9CELL|nr:hypothetical protein [Cellulomonas xylanilytica]GEK19952.1 hypothetical protein CXY01_04720 [Cellulomonas xylanilytica]